MTLSAPAAPIPEAPGPEGDQRVKDVLEAAARLYLDGPANTRDGAGERIYAEPLFGYAAGDDPLWRAIAEDIGEDFWPPEKAFALGRPELPIGPAGLSVAVVVCPQTKATIADQRRASGFPAKRWVVSRFLHGAIIDPLSDRLVAALAEAGYAAVAPDRLKSFGMIPHPRYQIAPQWSHRHAAFVAGLGTFGLCDGLITQVGKAHRLTSVGVAASPAPTPRPYRGPYDYCLWHKSGRCAKCVDSCPAGALTTGGHDKIRCQAFLMEVSKPKIARDWPDLAGAYGCGLCQTGVPCASGIPAR